MDAAPPRIPPTSPHRRELPSFPLHRCGRFPTSLVGTRHTAPTDPRPPTVGPNHRPQTPCAPSIPSHRPGGGPPPLRPAPLRGRRRHDGPRRRRPPARCVGIQPASTTRNYVMPFLVSPHLGSLHFSPFNLSFNIYSMIITYLHDSRTESRDSRLPALNLCPLPTSITSPPLRRPLPDGDLRRPRDPIGRLPARRGIPTHPLKETVPRQPSTTIGTNVPKRTQTYPTQYPK